MSLTRRTALLAAFTASLPSLPATAQTGKFMTTASGLQIQDTQVGTGAQPKRGQTCVMHYTGWLYTNGMKGKKFDSSVDRGEPFEFPLGIGRVIKGWDEGVATMKVGGKRTLIIPPQLGYGERGAGGVIPPHATLMFDVELLGVTQDWLRYKLPSRYIRRRRGRVCIGQKQKWFALRLIAEDSHVHFAASETPEFDGWRWVEYWHPLTEVVEFKREVYDSALGELAILIGAAPKPSL